MTQEVETVGGPIDGAVTVVEESQEAMILRRFGIGYVYMRSDEDRSKFEFRALLNDSMSGDWGNNGE